MKRTFPGRVAVAASAVVVLAAGCSSSGASGDNGGGGKGSLIGVDYPRSDTDFWNSYISYVPKSASSLGVTIKTTNSQNDVQKLIANAQALQSQGAKAFVIAPQDTAAIAPELAHFLGQKLAGKGAVVMLEGDTASINGRDRTDAFNSCMKSKYPGITVHGEPSKWDGPTAASQLQTALTQDPNIRGVYMESSFALSGTLQDLKQKGLLAPSGNPKHVFVVSNDGIPEELKDIRQGLIDATVSQPADLYAKYGLFYAKAALDGKTFKPGPTDHDSTIIQVRAGVLEDQLQAPLVTKSNVDDKSLWGNNL